MSLSPQDLILEQLQEAAEPLDDIQEEFVGELPLMVTLPGGKVVEAPIAERVLRCGTLMHGINPKTGEQTAYRYQCGLPHLCIRCAHERAMKEKQRVNDATGGEAYVAVMSVAEAKSEVRKLRDGHGADSYRRYPLENGQVAIIHNVDGGPGERKVLDTLDWHNLTATPRGKNISGKLKHVVPPPQDAEPVRQKVVKSEFVAATKPDDMSWRRYDELTTEAWELAVVKTAHLAPDLDTVELCMTERMRAYRMQLDAVGLVGRFSVYRHIMVREGEIDWTPYNSKILRKRGRNFSGIAFEQLDQAQWWMQKQYYN